MRPADLVRKGATPVTDLLPDDYEVITRYKPTTYTPASGRHLQVPPSCGAAPVLPLTEPVPSAAQSLGVGTLIPVVASAPPVGASEVPSVTSLERQRELKESTERLRLLPSLRLSMSPSSTARVRLTVVNEFQSAVYALLTEIAVQTTPAYSAQWASYIALFNEFKIESYKLTVQFNKFPATALAGWAVGYDDVVSTTSVTELKFADICDLPNRKVLQLSPSQPSFTFSPKLIMSSTRDVATRNFLTGWQSTLITGTAGFGTWFLAHHLHSAVDMSSAWYFPVVEEYIVSFRRKR